MVLWLILSSFALAIGYVTVGTWLGSARATYIRAYDLAHRAHLPAGFIEEWAEGVELSMADKIDWSKANSWALRARIVKALRERQADPALERLRVRAWQRTRIAWVLGTAAIIAWSALLIYTISNISSPPVPHR